MAYAGYLARVGSYEIPINSIIAKSYKVTYSVLDLDSYRDANGYLHRQALRKIPTVEMTIEPKDTSEIGAIWNNITSQFTSSMERKVSASIFVPEINDYYSGDFYIPDTDFSIRNVDSTKVYYEPLKLKMIGY